MEVAVVDIRDGNQSLSLDTSKNTSRDEQLEPSEMSTNFIVRVNQQNSSMVLTRVCPPTTVLRSPNKMHEFYLLVQVSTRGSFLRLPLAICQAKTMKELEQLNKQGIDSIWLK
ncbi:Protein sprint [Schistosoma japonicum]|nr:Protein sprint [Schistosoma japonicum]